METNTKPPELASSPSSELEQPTGVLSKKTQSQPEGMPVQQQRTDKQANKNKRFSLLLGWTGFREKTLWDWFQLLGVIAIPIVVVLVSSTFSDQQSRTSLLVSMQQHETDLEVASDQQREQVLVTYQQDISELLLNSHLSTSSQGDPVRLIARAKTLTALRRLDPLRKAFLIQFLYEAQLITSSTPYLDNSIISLQDADLSKITLNSSFSPKSGQPSVYGPPRPDGRNHCRLSRIDLSGADLSQANLENADLSYANLVGAILFQAKLSGADLSYADVSQAEMPNGSIYP